MRKISKNLLTFVTLLIAVATAAYAADDMTVVIQEDFEGGLPGGVHLVKVGGGGDPGVVDDGSGSNSVLRLTTGEGGQLAFAWFENQFDLATKRVEIEFDLYLGRGTSDTPADGGSVIFQFDNDMGAIADGGGANACGNLRNATTGETYEYVAVSFDIWDNGGADMETPCDGKYGGSSTAHVEVNQNSPNPGSVTPIAQAVSPDYVGSADRYKQSFDSADLVHVKIIFDNRLMRVTMSGPVGCEPDTTFPEQVVIDTVTQPFPDRLSNIGFGASTGGANSVLWIDNLVVREGPSKVSIGPEEPREAGALNCAGPEVDATGEIGSLFIADRFIGDEVLREGDIETGLTVRTASFGRVRVGGDNTSSNPRTIDVSKIPDAGPQTAQLFGTTAWSPVGVRYQAVVVPGRYTVDLFFAEDYSPTITGDRQSLKYFDVWIGSERVLCNWSPASAAGSENGSGDPRVPCTAVLDTGVMKTFSVDVPDSGDGTGLLDILVDDLGGGMPPENAVLNALRFQRTGDPTGEPASGDLECIGPDPADIPETVLISRDFEDDDEGACPADMVCNTSNKSPQVVAGSGAESGKVLRLTWDDTGDTAASAVFTQTVDVVNSALEAEFDIHMSWTGTPADGACFFIREGPDTNVLGGTGGSLGIPGGANGAVVEFDLWQGGGNNEPSGMNNGSVAFIHVGINNMSTDSTITNVQFDPNLKPVAFGGTGWPEFADPADRTIPGKVHVRVIYNAGHVQVYLTGTNADGTEFPETLVAEADVTPVRSTEAVVGFCGGTGGATANVDFDNIVIKAAPGVPDTSLADAREAALQAARERWQNGRGELYINAGGPMLYCSAVQVPAPAATGDPDFGEPVVWLADRGDNVPTQQEELFTVSSQGDAPGGNLHVAQTNMGLWDARGTAPGLDDNDTIFHFERWSDMEYAIPVADIAARYEVTLWFANSYSGTSGSARRFFSIYLEGQRQGGFQHCPEVAPGVPNPLADDGTGNPYDKIFDPVDAAEQLYSSDPCNFATCANNGVTVGDDPDGDGIPADQECGNAAAVAVRAVVEVSDGVLNIAILDPDVAGGEPASPDGNPKLSGIAVKFIGPVGTNVYTGDANCDGAVDIADAICTLGYLFGAPDDPCKEPCCQANMDANDDNGVDIADAISMLSFLFGGENMIAPDGTAIAAQQDGCFLYPVEDVTLPCAQPCAK